MHRTKFEKQRDDLIGEAVLLILKSKGPINFKSLAMKLKNMALTERDSERRSALSAAIVEIEQRIKSTAGEHAEIREHYNIEPVRRLMMNHKHDKTDKKH